MGAMRTAAGITAAAGGAALAGHGALVALAVPAVAVLLVLAWVLADPDRSSRLAEILRAARGADRGRPR